ncbi:MAG: YdeI/OmpD-associated family protein [Candidatus Kapaibacterium sp.]
MIRQEFEAQIEEIPGNPSEAAIIMPFDSESVFGTRAEVNVSGTIDDISFNNTLQPLGGGKHILVLNNRLLSQLKKGVGNIVHLILQTKEPAATMELPDDFDSALEQNAVAKEYFERLSPSHKRDYLDWINESKQDETRESRIEKAIQMLRDKREI